jgi:hypothetical protein
MKIRPLIFLLKAEGTKEYPANKANKLSEWISFGEIQIQSLGRLTILGGVRNLARV